MRLAVLSSHPIQYQAPLFRTLAERLDLTVFFAHRATSSDQARAGFGVGFDWDIDLLTGYAHEFLQNVSRRPGLDHFGGCDIPDIGPRLRDGAFDAVLIQGWHLKAYMQTVFSAKCQGLPVIVRGDSHLESPRSIVHRLAKFLSYPVFLRLFDAALYVGERSRAYWTHYRYPSSRMFFSPHCVDARWFTAHSTHEARAELRERLRIAPNAKIALFAGKLIDFKRPFDLVAAAGRLKVQGLDVGILVAGSGPLETELTSLARTASVAIYSLGFCNQSKMPSVYAAADLLVLPSDSRETWGLVANEALACTRPIILSNAVGSAPDLAADGLAGCVFPCGDVSALADAIARTLNHPPSPTAVATKSAQYSLESAADGIVRAVESVKPSKGTFRN